MAKKKIRFERYVDRGTVGARFYATQPAQDAEAIWDRIQKQKRRAEERA